MKFIVPALVLTLLPFFSVTFAFAGNHALLIGVGSYKVPDLNLNGPPNDVRAVKELLKRYSFPPANTVALIDAQATKQAILDNITSLETRTRSGDTVFIYFSGHGTSFYDKDVDFMSGTSFSSGAIVPYDFVEIKKNPQKTLNALIIGNRDLQPLFRRLDVDRKLFVVFDSCFSGNAVRSILKMTGPTRFVPIDIPADDSEYKAVPEAPYPYRNLIYMAAAHQTEKARDLTPGDGTFDGQPHGAFSNFLITGLKGEADTNHDGRITYEELFGYARNATQKFGHTPQIKFASGVEQLVFGASPQLPSHQASPIAAGLSKLTCRIDKVKPALRKRIASVEGLAESSGAAEIIIEQTASGLRVIKSNGDLIATHTSDEALLTFLGRFVKVRTLLSLRNPEQQFNITLYPVREAGKTVFIDGETLDFEVKSEKNASLLLVNIDSSGLVTVILPGPDASGRVTKETPLVFKDYAEIAEPFGSDTLKLIAFPEDVPELKMFAGSVIDPTGRQFESLMTLLKSRKGWSETTLPIVTVPKGGR